MKKYIVAIIFIVIMSAFTCVYAADTDCVSLTVAEQNGSVLTVSGQVCGGAKGMNVGVVVYNSSGGIAYIGQCITGEVDSNGDSPFIMEPVETSENMEGYLVKASAIGYTSAEKTVELLTDKAFYVCPDNGDDSNDGSIASPFKTIVGARNAVRAYKSKTDGILSCNVNVYLREGIYVLSETVTFTEEDSGNNGYTITYCAYEGETPRIVAAGHVFDNWTQGTDGVWTATGGPNYIISSLSDARTNVGIPARIPNPNESDDGYFEAVRVGTTNSDESKISFSSKASDSIPEISDISSLNAIVWPNGAGWYNWKRQRKRVVSVTPGTTGHIFTLYSMANYTINNNSRYYLEGAKEFMDIGGEFYYDRTNGILSFIPPENFEMTADTPIYASSSYNAISLIGSANAVENLKLEGLDITGVGNSYYGIYMNNAKDSEVAASRIHDVDGSGIMLHNIAENINIESNEIFNAENGVVLVSNITTDKNSRVTKNNIVNNHIYNLVGSGAGINAANTSYTLIAHNSVHGSDRHGIWVYGGGLKRDLIDNEYYENLFGDITEDNVYEFMRSHHNTIEYNDVYDCMRDSQDGGTIYTSRTHNNIIRYNNVHDSIMRGIGINPGMNGLYLDDDSDFNEVYGNTIYNMGGIDGGYISVPLTATGCGNIFQNNIIASNGTGTDTPPSSAVRFYGPTANENVSRGNIIYNSGTNMFTSTYAFGFDESDGSIIYNAELNAPMSENSYTYTVKYDEVGGTELEAVTFDVWKAARGYDVNTVIADPLFMDADNGDFRFMPASPALAKGIAEISRQSIGLRADFPYAVSGEYSRIFITDNEDNVNKGTVILAKGNSLTLNSVVRNKDGFIEENANVTYSTSNPSAVQVGETSGLVTALGEGSAVITATAGGVSTQIHIVVDGKTMWLEDNLGNEITSDIKNHDTLKACIDTALIPDFNIATVMPMVAVYDEDSMMLYKSDFEFADGILTAQIDISKIKDRIKTLKIFCWERSGLIPKVLPAVY